MIVHVFDRYRWNLSQPIGWDFQIVLPEFRNSVRNGMTKLLQPYWLVAWTQNVFSYTGCRGQPHRCRGLLFYAINGLITSSGMPCNLMQFGHAHFGSVLNYDMPLLLFPLCDGIGCFCNCPAVRGLLTGNLGCGVFGVPSVVQRT